MARGNKQPTAAELEEQKRRSKYDQDEAIEKPFDGRLMLRLLVYLRPYRGTLVFILGLMLILTITGLASPYLMKIAIDEHIANGDVRGLTLIGLVLMGVHFTTFFSSRARTRNMNRLGQSILYDMRKQLFEHIQHLSFKFYDSRPAGKIMVRITNDVNQLNNLITGGLVNVITDLFSITGIVLIMLYMNPQLTLYSMITVPLLVVIATWLRTRVRNSWRDVRRRNANINANLQETLSGMRVIQCFSREKFNLRLFTDLNDDYFSAWMRAMRINMLFGPSVELTQVLGAIIVYWFGSKLLFDSGTITVGELIAFTSYLSRFWGPISNLSNVYNQLLVSMASAERVFEILDYPVDVDDAPGAIELPDIAGQVDFEHVDFGYDERIVLHDINLSVKPGQTVALVGPTGAGKSSIINLICRFYDPVAGAVRIDGHDLRDVSLKSLRSQLGIVLQDTFMFSGTVKDNIRYGRLDASDAEIIAAAKAVNAHDFIMQFEYGYDTPVQERGSKLSVGQRQLISFARALLADPRILILDEATSSIDTQTEQLIQEALEVLLRGRTSFIIAHRLSTIRSADVILVIDDGRIIEQGTHEELLLRRGVYYELNQAQFKYDQMQVASN
ncbi:MAG: ABC transporter ATP-binding protein [Bacillota bacterium]|jgi:ATP-binding cassette subfamily B multidrug efflux pump